jgi:hypothetical protein
MTSDPAKTPLRMTAQEFVTCIAVMAGAAKVKERKPKNLRLVVMETKPIPGKFRWHTVPAGAIVTDGPEKVEVKTARRVKVPVHHVICTHLNHGKKYPLCSLGSRPIRKTHRRGCCAFLSGFKSHAVGCYAEPRRFTDRANPQRQHPIPIDVQRSVGIVAGRDQLAAER